MKRRVEAKAREAAEIEAREAAVAPATERTEEIGRRSRLQPVADFKDRL